MLAQSEEPFAGRRAEALLQMIQPAPAWQGAEIADKGVRVFFQQHGAGIGPVKPRPAGVGHLDGEIAIDEDRLCLGRCGPRFGLTSRQQGAGEIGHGGLSRAAHPHAVAAPRFNAQQFMAALPDNGLSINRKSFHL